MTPVTRSTDAGAVAVDEAPLDRRADGHRHEGNAHGASGEVERPERIAQEHEHGEAHHADGHAREEGNQQQGTDVRLAKEGKVALLQLVDHFSREY
jgi:hypothetical protein